MKKYIKKKAVEELPLKSKKHGLSSVRKYSQIRLRHCVKLLGKTRLFVSRGVLFKNAFAYCAVDSGAHFGEESGSGSLVSLGNDCKELLNVVFNLSFYHFVLLGLLFGN